MQYRNLIGNLYNINSIYINQIECELLNYFPNDLRSTFSRYRVFCNFSVFVLISYVPLHTTMPFICTGFFLSSLNCFDKSDTECKMVMHSDRLQQQQQQQQQTELCASETIRPLKHTYNLNTFISF